MIYFPMRAAFLPVFLGLLAGTAPLFAQTHVIEKFDGSTAKTTGTFTVGDKWEVVWNSPAPLHVTLLNAGGEIVAGTAGMFRGSLYQPKGGTFYLQVSGAGDGPMPHWDISVVEVGPATPTEGMADGGPNMNFVPPSVLPPAAPTPSAMPAPAPAAPTVAAAPAPIPTLTEDQTRAVVMIEGDNAEGTGFLVKTPDGPAVVTNLHVLANNPNIRIMTNTGAQITALGMKGATDRDLAMLPIKDDNYNYLTLDTDASADVQPGDVVITPGNSQGGEVVLNTHGTVLAIGPDRIEFSNPIYHGNSGGPVFDAKNGKVLGVVTEAMKVDTGDDLDKASFQSSGSAITQTMRYFGLRIDTVPRWETYDPAQFQTETAFLDRFQQQSRRLDSYLNSNEKTDGESTGGNDDESEPPNSRLYLSDDRIVKAHDRFEQNATGADAAERLDAFRGWLFELNNIADLNMDAIQNQNNFYTFDQQRARDELAYRKALKKELDGFGNDVDRAESLGLRN
jgi:hypothetical protein